MSTIKISVLLHPDSAAPSQRIAHGGEVTIGRDRNCDFRLTGDRAVSKVHCVLSFVAGRWQLQDVSRNGTFINDSDEPLGNRTHEIVSWDRLKIGDHYEIEIALAETEPAYTPPGFRPDGRTGEEQRSKKVIPDKWYDEGAGEPSQQPPVPYSARKPGEAPEPPTSHPPASAAPLLRALCAGAGVSESSLNQLLADPESLLQNVGSVLKAAVSGACDILRARGEVKREFRIEETMHKSAGNSPLKYSTDDQQALIGVLASGADGARWMEEAMNDLRTHQLATMHALQEAALAMLDEVAPKRVKANARGVEIPGLREKRLWAAYESEHARLVARFNDAFDSVFGKQFARAYEAETRRLRKK